MTNDDICNYNSNYKYDYILVQHFKWCKFSFLLFYFTNTFWNDEKMIFILHGVYL